MGVTVQFLQRAVNAYHKNGMQKTVKKVPRQFMQFRHYSVRFKHALQYLHNIHIEFQHICTHTRYFVERLHRIRIEVIPSRTKNFILEKYIYYKLLLVYK